MCEGAPNANATKIWITKAGKCYLCHNNSRIPERTLRKHHENHRGPQCRGHPKVERLLWRGTILLLRLFGDFPPVFLFGSKISAHSTKQAPLFLELAAGTGQHRPFHVLRCAFPHPLQNRVPRVQVLLPLPGLLAKNDAGTKKAGIPGFFRVLRAEKARHGVTFLNDVKNP